MTVVVIAISKITILLQFAAQIQRSHDEVVEA